MKRLAHAIGYAIAGYFAGALLGYAAVMGLSTNTHDRAMEAGMTGAFFFGPLVGIIAGVIGALRAKPS